MVSKHKIIEVVRTVFEEKISTSCAETVDGLVSFLEGKVEFFNQLEVELDKLLSEEKPVDLSIMDDHIEDSEVDLEFFRKIESIFTRFDFILTRLDKKDTFTDENGEFIIKSGYRWTMYRDNVDVMLLFMTESGGWFTSDPYNGDVEVKNLDTLEVMITNYLGNYGIEY